MEERKAKKPTLEELEDILDGKFPKIRIEPNGELKVDCENCPFNTRADGFKDLLKAILEWREGINNLMIIKGCPVEDLIGAKGELYKIYKLSESFVSPEEE